MNAREFLIDNDDFDYNEIDGVDVPTYDSIAKVMEAYHQHKLASDGDLADVSISVCNHWWRNIGVTLQGKPVKQCCRCGKTEC